MKFQVYLISFIYLCLFIVSEFRLRKMKFLVSIYYATLLMVYLIGLLLIDAFIYRFSRITYMFLALIVVIQIYSFLCRIYLWDDPHNPYRRYLHPEADHHEDNHL